LGDVPLGGIFLFTAVLPCCVGLGSICFSALETFADYLCFLLTFYFAGKTYQEVTKIAQRTPVYFSSSYSSLSSVCFPSPSHPPFIHLLRCTCICPSIPSPTYRSIRPVSIHLFIYLSVHLSIIVFFSELPDGHLQT
jgi:hypothetical protein